MSSPSPMFGKVALIGIGLIGSSLCRVMRRNRLAGSITGHARSGQTRAKALELGLVDDVYDTPGEAVEDADLVIFCVPVGACGPVAEAIRVHLKPGAIVTDVGSVKETVVRDIKPHLPDGVHLIPGHPIAGTEHSGPEAGFAELFENRWCILTPDDATDPDALDRLKAFWRACGSDVEIMDVVHHDLVLAVTSHVPHLIAYNIVMTAKHLEDVTDSEVIKFSAAGFRDFTRIAASDPTMWRDVFLNNKDATLEILGRFSEDLAALQRAVRWGDGDMLFDLFSKSRAVRRGILEAGQDTSEPDFGRLSSGD
ncbi:MAG: prephenate/arogenate dehydrogenase family protein [Pseudomonadota bacterium]